MNQGSRSGPRRATISQVADLAGVSIATVSRVMNGVPTVDSGLSDRVREAAEALGYTPSAVAQGLASGSTRTVGVVVPDLGNPYFHQVLKGIANAARVDGYHMLVSESNENPGAEKALAGGMLGRVDGLILVSPRMGRSDLTNLADTGHPIVCVNRAEEGVGVPTISIDSREGIVEIVGHLVQLGHKRLAYLAGPKLSWSNQVRSDALTQVSSFGVTVESIDCGAQMDDGRRIVDEAQETGATAFIGYNDLVALGLISALSERSVVVGRDISVAGFDDIPVSGWWSPSLTTVRTPQRELGEGSWRLMRDVLGGERYAIGGHLVPELVIRQSTGPAPESAPWGAKVDRLAGDSTAVPQIFEGDSP